MNPLHLLAELRALDVHLYVEGGRLRVNAPKGKITPALEAALVAAKDALVRELEAAPLSEAAPAAEALPALTQLPRTSTTTPLSFFQERLWVIDRLHPGIPTYNFGAMFDPAGPVDAERLSAALRRVIARHDILRSRFVLEGETPVTRLAPVEATPIVVSDLRAEPAEAQRRALDAAPGEAVSAPFDLASDAPVRFRIFRLADDRVALLISAHHIALDAWSFALLVRAIQTEYLALEGGALDITPTQLQYADFAAWQREISLHPSGLARLKYWKNRLAGLPSLSVFPRDHLGASEVSLGATLPFAWPPALYFAVRALARESGATPYMVLVAAVAAVLHRHTGQTDLALGSPIGTRDQRTLEDMIGPIVNPLVLRFDVSDDPSFSELIRRAREALLEGHANQEVPFERIVRELNPERTPKSSPLFQVAVVLHNAPDASLLHITSGGAVYDITLFATERDGTLQGSYEYRSDLYERATVARIAGHVQNLLEGATQNGARRVSELPLIDEAERASLLERFNDTAVAVDRRPFVAQFASVAAARPDQVAVVASDRSLTYGALDQLSSRLAAKLVAAGAGPGRFVALATDRSSALPVAMLAILKASAAYVPIDPTYPAERVALMLEDSGAQQLLTTRAALGTPALRGARVSPVIVDELLLGADEAAELPSAPSPSDVAYMMYTSGSTGTPKGVMVPHSSLSNFFGAMQACVGLGESDTVLAVTSPSFDISVLELLWPLVHGAKVVIADREDVTDGGRLASTLKSAGATLLQSTPSTFRLLMSANWEGDSKLTAIVGGEPLPPALAYWLRPRVKTLWNAYGPTETTVWSTMARIDDDGPITIGTPVANTQVYVLDKNRQPVPIGAVGEITIAGDGVALGYHRRDELTAERFVPSLASSNEKMYRTGDLGRYRADGRLDHLGRLDGQVKVRGYRIETGEIEMTLARHEAVKQAVVDVRSVAADDPRIVAWVKLHDTEDCTGSELRRHLRRSLPEFMIPSMVVFVDSFPLTPNGKIDRRALPDAFASEDSGRADGRPPSTKNELVVSEIWTRLLNLKQVSVTDTFFELGGHSLLAMRAAQELGLRIGHAVDPRLLFFLTLGQLAENCDARQAGDAQS